MNVLLAAMVIFGLGIQAYHYILYPGLLWVLARVRPKSITKGAYSGSVTIVTAAYNEAPIISGKIDDLLSQSRRGLQIIIVSDGSTDRTGEISKGYEPQGVEVISIPNRLGKSNALNAGFDRAKGDIVVISDANTECAPDAIDQLVCNFADPSVGLVSGYVTSKPTEERQGSSSVAKSEGLYWRYEAAIRRWETAAGSTVAVVGALLAVRKELYPQIPLEAVNDDSFLALHVLRSGHRVVFEPEARCLRRSSATMGDDAKRRRRMAAGRHQLLLNLRQWPWNNPLASFFLLSHKFLRLLLPFMMLTALFANIALAAVAPLTLPFQLTLAAQITLYALAALGYVNEQRKRKTRLAALAYYVVRGNLGVLQGFVQHLRGQRTVLWQKVDRV